MGLIEASSKRAYAIPRSTAPRAPAPAAGCCWPIPPQETLRHSSGSVSVGWTCVLCHSQCWRAQVTRYLVSALSQVSCASTSLVPATHFPGCAAKALSQVCRMSPLESWSQTVTRMVAVSHPGSQEDKVSSWEPAHCLMEDAISGTEIAVPLAAGSGCCKPASLSPGGEGPLCSRLALLWYSLNPSFCEWGRLCVRLLC